jgi:predicted amidohydrolase YtcJ
MRLSDDGKNFGSQMLSPGEMKKTAYLAAEEGFSIHIHAIGDEAVSRSLDVLSSLGKTGGTKTIAHNQVYSSDDVEKMKAAGDIFFQTTPHWMTGDEHTLKCLGEKRYLALPASDTRPLAFENSSLERISVIVAL